MKLFSLIAREIRAALKSKFFIAVLFLVPLVLGLFMGFTFTWKRIPQQIPVAVWNRDSQNLSREFLRSLNSTQAFHSTHIVTDIEAGKALLVSGKVRGFLIIPPDFSMSLRTGKQTRVIFFQDFNYLLPGRTLAKTISKVEGWEQERWFKYFFQQKGLSGTAAEFLKNPVRIEYRKLFNPTLEYTQFVLPGLLMAVLFQILIIVGGYSMFTSKESYVGVSALTFLAAKTITYLFLCMIPFGILYGLFFPLFDLLVGNVLLMFLYYLLFGLATLFLGMLIASIFKEPIFATEIIIALGAVAFTFSGFTWPRAMFPAFFKHAVVIFPLTSFLEESSKIWYQTHNPLNPWPLIILAVVFFIPLLILDRKRSFKDDQVA